MLSDFLEAAHDVVSAIADGAGGEGGKAFHGGGSMLLQEFLDDRKDISGAAGRLFIAAMFDRDFGAARLEAQERPDAKKSVAADFFSAFDGFEEEGVGLAVGYSEKGGNRGEQVSGDGFHHRDQSASARDAKEVFVVRTDHTYPRCFIIRKRHVPPALAYPAGQQYTLRGLAAPLGRQSQSQSQSSGESYDDCSRSRRGN